VVVKLKFQSLSEVGDSKNISHYKISILTTVNEPCVVVIDNIYTIIFDHSNSPINEPIIEPITIPAIR